MHGRVQRSNMKNKTKPIQPKTKSVFCSKNTLFEVQNASNQLPASKDMPLATANAVLQTAFS